MSGQVDLYFGNSSELLPHIDSDRIRLIAVGTAQRLATALRLALDPSQRLAADRVPALTAARS